MGKVVPVGVIDQPPRKTGLTSHFTEDEILTIAAVLQLQMVLTSTAAELSCWPDRARGVAAGASDSGSGSANAANTDVPSNTAGQQQLSPAPRC